MLKLEYHSARIIPQGEREPNRSFLHLNEIEEGLWLVEASLRLGEDHAKGHDNGEDNEDRNREEQKDIEEEIHPFQSVGLTGRRVEQYFGLSHLHNGFQLGESVACEVHGNDKKHLGCDV
jgi:hypothetical protein